MEKKASEDIVRRLSNTLPTLLVVDDEASICALLQKILSREGYHVLTATSAKEALALTKKEKPRLAIVDVYMPDTDGIELLQHLHRQDDGMVVVMLSGHGSADVARSAMSHGAYDYILKPFDHHLVVSIIEEALSEEETLSEEVKKRA